MAGNSKKPKVSIVIPARNEEKHISECISSVKRQITSFPYEILVVDNASKDTTAKIAESLGAKVILEKHKGLSFARQKGLDAAKGEFIVYIDADTRLPEDWISYMIGYLEEHPRLVGASCSFHFYDGKPMDGVGVFFFKQIVIPIASLLVRTFKRTDIIFGWAFVVRAEALRKAGGINKKFIFYGEDTGIAYRLRSQGRVKFLKNKYALISARRFQQKGIQKFSIIFDWTIFVLMLLGMHKEAEQISKAYLFSKK